jgi:hypothetical protein
LGAVRELEAKAKAEAEVERVRLIKFLMKVTTQPTCHSEAKRGIPKS